MPTRSAAIFSVLLAAAMLLAGCGRPAGPLFETTGTALVWPLPPETARIQYLGSLSTSADLKPARGPFQGLGEMIFGAEPPQTMLSPLAVCRDGGSRLYVADSNGQVLHVFDLESREYLRWRPPETQRGFGQPVGVAIGLDGRVLVVDSVAAEVFVFDPAGAFRGVFGAGALKRPCGIAVEPSGGRIFIADAEAHQIVAFTPDGREAGRLGTRGSGPGQFNFPTNLAFDRSGNLFVSDTLNFRIQVFDQRLQPVRQIGTKGDLPGYFSQPKGIAVDPADRLYVVDANFEAVQVFTNTGDLLMAFGREGRAPGEFWLPAGVCADAQGRIWVADSYNQRIQVFQSLTDGSADGVSR